MFLIILLVGCEITGRVVEEIENTPTQEEKNQIDLENALAEKDISVCYGIQSQLIRDDCFVLLAKELRDESICNNLLGKSLRNSCKDNI